MLIAKLTAEMRNELTLKSLLLLGRAMGPIRLLLHGTNGETSVSAVFLFKKRTVEAGLAMQRQP